MVKNLSGRSQFYLPFVSYEKLGTDGVLQVEDQLAKGRLGEVKLLGSLCVTEGFSQDNKGLQHLP